MAVYLVEKRKEERARAQWTAMLPFMSMKLLKFVPFQEYFDQVTGKNIDMRPAEEILAEIHEAFREE